MDVLRRYRLFVIAGAALACIGILWAIAAPRNFPTERIVVVTRGETATEISQNLGDAHIVAHPLALRIALRLMGGASSIQAGAYQFKAPQNALTIAYRLAHGVYGIEPAKVTLVEGSSVREGAAVIAAALPEITEKEFITAAQPYEGYLFPDTYMFPPGEDAASVVATMRANFNEKIQPLLGAIATSTHSLGDIVTMASLLEKEARTTATRRIIAGILWHRIALHMPLQVDAVFGYIFNRDTYSPSFADLKVDSPYNTYTHVGLPPTPIDNPGLDSIEAALYPTKTDYLYYLVDKEGVTHYATTFASHQANQNKYLR